MVVLATNNKNKPKIDETSYVFWNLDSIDSPQGGATAASPFVCRNVGGPPCLVGLHVQDCIAEGTWGNDIFNFGYDLASIFARAT